MITETYTEKAIPERKVDLSDSLKEQIERNVLWGFLMMVTLVYAVLSARSATGIAVGGLISFLNFRDLKRSLERFFAAIVKEGRKTEGLIIARYYFKLALLFVLLAYLLKNGLVDVVALAIGLFLVPATLIFTGISLYIGSLGGNKR
ncbi:MAG: ATP synthase subunit I [Deltaproteobacteria bacterium]|nr:ATP synthase subunit I [Deltaproteobacteria bacterium]